MKIKLKKIILIVISQKYDLVAMLKEESNNNVHASPSINSNDTLETNASMHLRNNASTSSRDNKQAGVLGF